MGKGGGSAKAPPIAPPVAIPDESPEAAEFARRKIPRSRQDTFLTGNLVPDTGKKKRLG